MGALGPTVKLTFAGDSRDLERKIKEVEARTSTLGSKLGKVGKGVAAFAAIGGSVNMIGGAVGAVTALTGAAAVLPAVALAGAAAMQTWKMATAGFGEAMKAGLSGDVEALAAATKDMHPEMAKAATTVAAMKPQVDGLKKAVQGGFWDQFSVGIKNAGDTYLPLLTKQLPQLSTELGNMAKQAVNASTTPFFSGAVSTILQNTTGMFRGLRAAGADVLTGLVAIGQIGSTYLPNLGQSVGSLTARFKAWATSFEGRNQIQAWINGGILAFRQLGAIVGNIGSVVKSVFTGLGGSIESPLAKVQQFTAKLAEFAASQNAQMAFQALGTAAQAAGILMSGTFLAALNALAPIIIALSPLITSIATTLATWAPVLGPLAVGVFGLVKAFQAVSAGLALYNAAMTLAKSQTIITVATTVASWATMAAGAVARAAVMAGAWVIAMGPVGWVIAAVVGLVALVIANWDTVKSATLAAWNAVSSAVASAWSAVSGAVKSAASAVVSACSSAWNTVKSGAVAQWNAITGAIRSGITTAVNFVRQLPSQITGIFSGAASWLVNAGSAIINGLWNGIKSRVSAVINYVRDIMGQIRAYFPFSPAKKGPFSGHGYTTYSGAALMEGFGQGITSSEPAVKSAASTVMSGASNTLAGPARQGGGGSGSGSGAAVVSFTGNTSDALATVIMAMIRQGKIQIKAA